MRPLRIVLCLFTLCLSILANGALAADPPQDQRKHTSFGKYVTAVEAYDLWKKEPGKFNIVDVRTPEEYVFLGHPGMAANVPVQLWAGNFDAQKKAYPLAANPQFAEDMKRRFKPGDALILMCRSGHRSATAAKILAEAGFTNVYNMVDGFEGDTIADKAHPHFGQRLKDGWRNSANPWTQDLDPGLAYISGK